MHIVLTESDLSRLKPSTRADILSTLFPRTESSTARGEFDWTDVVDLTPGEVEHFMEGCAPETIAGLRVIAENGPVIHATLLQQAGLENYGHFQGRVTKRTRTVTGDRHAFLFTWDDWSQAEDGVGRYAVTDTTHRSLRVYFNLI